MNIKFKNITGKELQDFYNSFEEDKTFLQTEKYAKFREAVGETVLRFGAYEEAKLVGTALIQKITTRFKTFLHCPHGPLLQLSMNNDQSTILDSFLDFYKELGKKEGCDFVRISPLINIQRKDKREEIRDNGELNSQLSVFQKQGFRPAPVHLVNPEKTLVLDITQSEEDILKQMKKSSRYEINRIGKFGIEVQTGNSTEDLDIFWELHEETFKRQKFVPFPRKNTEIQLKVWGNDCQIFSAKTDNKFCSSSIILFDKNAGYYHQGASIYSKAPVANACLWEAIKFAKNKGCKEFNFWGVVNPENKKHPWWGLSRFKRGFGGEERNFLHCQDFPITAKYWLNYTIEKYRKWKKGY
ncbi:MAG: peptidoglycan bridge formation glycyltransferase FemA/FemB family protein [Candidatus Peregrinibacteria bacterium]|nr:peptidoglycan bridge formation glycyltransferase FemA/FemB family protein [Candidatus Peregrinibacteria bacterium]